MHIFTVLQTVHARLIGQIPTKFHAVFELSGVLCHIFVTQITLLI